MIDIDKITLHIQLTELIAKTIDLIDQENKYILPEKQDVERYKQRYLGITTDGRIAINTFRAKVDKTVSTIMFLIDENTK